MVTIARQPLGISVEVPQEISIGEKTYILPPHTSTLVPNPNVISGGAGIPAGMGGNPSIMVELGKRLLESAENGDVDHVKELIGRGAPMTADWLGTSPLHKAALKGHFQTAKTLLSSGCSRDARTKVEKTALHLAASGGHANIVDLLLSANAEVNCTDMLRMTPLHWAVESGDIQSVELLLRHGADVNIENKFDKSPLEIASDKHQTDIYEMLLNAESYRARPHNESEIATRTITTELNAHHDQYELTETITVPPEAAHTEVVQADANNASMKILSNYGIKMLPEEDDDSSLMHGHQTLSLTEAGKRLLSDTSPVKTLVQTPKLQTVQIKQEGSIAPKIIRISNGGSLGSSPATVVSSTSSSSSSSANAGQPRVIRLSSSQLNNLKLASGLKGQKVMIVSSGGNKVTNTSTTSNTIKIVQVGSQAQAQTKKTIAIMPPKSAVTTTTTSISNHASKVSSAVTSEAGENDLKRQLEELQAEVEKDRLALDQKLAKIKRLRAALVVDESSDMTDDDNEMTT